MDPGLDISFWIVKEDIPTFKIHLGINTILKTLLFDF